MYSFRKTFVQPWSVKMFTGSLWRMVLSCVGEKESLCQKSSLLLLGWTAERFSPSIILIQSKHCVERSTFLSQTHWDRFNSWTNNFSWANLWKSFTVVGPLSEVIFQIAYKATKIFHGNSEMCKKLSWGLSLVVGWR